MDRVVLYYFRDEIEKQGISPSYSLKHWNTPGIRGSIARGYGKFFSTGPGNPERMARLDKAVQSMARPEMIAMGPEFALATAKGVGKAEALKSAVPVIKKNPAVADGLTWYEQNVPSHLFGSGYSKAVEKAGPLKNVLGL